MRTYVNLLSCVATAFFMAVTFFSACGPEMEPVEDDNNEQQQPEQPGEQDQLTEQYDSLANILQRQVRAMSMLLSEENLLLSYCRETEVAGQYEMSFDGGQSFTVFPDLEDGYAVLSYVEEGDAKYWSLLDKQGNSTLMKNTAGSGIAVDQVPEVAVTSEGYSLKHYGATFASDYTLEDSVRAFECSVIKDEEGVVYAVKFAFGEQKGRTVYVSGYNGVKFYLLDDQAKESLTEICVDWNTSASLGLYIPEGVEYKFICTEGWSISLKEGSASEVVVKAPEMSEQAASQGVIKVVSNDDIFTFAALEVTTDPFRTLLASATKVVVVPSMGIDKFAYGVSLKADFDEETTLVDAEKWIAGQEEPKAGSAVAESSVSKTFAEVIGNDLDADAEYILWAAANGHLKSVEFSKINVGIEAVQTRLLDADIKVTVDGANAVFGGVVEKSDETLAEIVYQLENSVRDSIPVADKNFVFEGLMSDYPAVDSYRNEIMPESTYIVWAAYAVDGDYEYTESDVFYKEISTNSVVEGGLKTVEFGTPETTVSTIKVPVTSDGAAMIYYAVLNNSNGTRYSSAEVPNDKKYEALMANSPVAVRGNSVVANPTKLNPNATYWVYAVAVDEDGKYGPVSCVSAKTQVLVYDETIKLTVDTKEIKAQKLVLQVTSTGGDLSDYVYWTGRRTEAFWQNSVYCGESKWTAEKYMALNPDDEYITKAMNKYGSISSDGTITIDGLQMETEYVFLILEKGEEHYSRIGYIMVKTLAADLGTIVREGTDEWNAAKAAIKLDWDESRFEPAANSSMTASYGFRFYCPDNLTAYVMAASDTYFSGAGITKMEHIMIEIENQASRRYADGCTPINPDGSLAEEPDYYKDGELKPGQLMNVYTFNVHGLPTMGFVTYFAKGSHGEGNCVYWDNGHCEQYETYAQSIAKYSTLAPWEERAKAFGLTGQEAADWAQALLEAYSVYYKDAKPIVYENDGTGIYIYAPYAMGVNDKGVVTDRVVVMFKDLDGNYYEPMYFEVPNYFE